MQDHAASTERILAWKNAGRRSFQLSRLRCRVFISPIDERARCKIGTATGIGTMVTSSTIGSLFLTTVSGLDWIPRFYPYDDYYAYNDQDYYGYDASNDPYSVSMSRGRPDRTWPGKVTIAV